MRKRQRAEHRKRKILKLDEEGVSLFPITVSLGHITLYYIGLQFSWCQSTAFS